jgi:signal transduction histidine kinase
MLNVMRKGEGFMGRQQGQTTHGDLRSFENAHVGADTTPAFLAVGTCEMEPVSEKDVFQETEVVEIVHDLKNPLSTIALEMCLLGDKLGEHAGEDVKATLGRVNQNVVFLDRMVQDILDCCSLEAGRLRLNRRKTELCALLEHCIDRSIATRDRTRVFLDAKCRVTLLIDDLRIERVVANLLQNALKYARRSTGVIVRLELGHHAAKVSVIDSGPGLTSEEMNAMFDRYRRGTSSRGIEGSGLGLYVAKRIIEAHGGSIGVESVRNVGSRFFFELPM